MKKILDLSKSVYELSKENDDFLEIMSKVGFNEIKSSIALNSMGKIMTIEKGAKIKGIDFKYILDEFRKNNYEIVDENIIENITSHKKNSEVTQKEISKGKDKSMSLFIKKEDVDSRKERFELLKS